MNRSYKSVWNTALGAWVAVSEITRAGGKRGNATKSGSAIKSPKVVACAVLIFLGAAPSMVTLANAADKHYDTPGNQNWGNSPNGGFDQSIPNSNDRAIYDRAGTGMSYFLAGARSISQLVFLAPYTGSGFVNNPLNPSAEGSLTILGSNGLGIDNQVNQQITLNRRLLISGDQEWRISSLTGSITQLTAAPNTSSSLSLGSNMLTLNAVNAANFFQLNNPITGAGGLIAKGAGTVRLDGINTYTGGTTMNGGTVEVAADNNLGAATGALSFGGGTLHTTASFTMNRATTLNAGSGVIDTDAGTTLVQNAVISGIGGLGKEGAGTLQLTGINTYTGATTINAGTLSLTGTGSISESSKVVANGTFNISGIAPASASIKSLSGGSSGIVTLGARTLTITNANDTFAGSIQGAGGLTLNGGNLTLTGNNTFTGARNISGGNLRIESGGQISGTTAQASSIGTGTNGSVVVTGVGSYFKANSLRVGDSAQGQFLIENGAKSEMTSTLTIGVGGGTGRVVVTGAGSEMTTSGIVMGQGAGSQGFLDITDGAKVYSNGIQFSQFQPNGWGVANVSGAGSYWQGTSINVSSGILNVLDQGAVQATGTLIIGGLSAHFGEVRVAGGSTLNSNGAMTVGTAGNGVLTIAQGGVVTPGTGTLNIANGAGTGILNIGGTQGGAAEAAGTLTANNVIFGAGTGRINFNHTDTNYLFNPIISGNGTINQNGLGLTRLNVNNSGFTGTTNVNAGTLSVNSILGGTMEVHGGRLQGIGQVGNTTNFTGGTIAPGNSIGTLLIAGNYTGNGGVLEMEAVLAGTGSPADRLLITGNATGNTIVNVINTGGSGALTGAGNTDGISIIQVGGTSTASTFQLAGGYAAVGAFQYTLKAFDPASSAVGEVDPRLAAVPFWDYRLQSLVDSSGNPVAVPQIAGYQAMPTGAVRYGTSLLDSLHKRLGEIRETATLQNQIGSTEQRSKEVFLRTQGSSSDVSGNSASGYDQDIWYVQAGGNLFGRDMADGAELRIGGALSIGGSKLNADESSAKVDLRGTTLALTSTYQAATGWYLDAVAQGTRYTSEITTSQRGETGDPKGWGWGLSLEGGYPFDMGNGLILEPQAQLTYQRIRFDKFTDVDRIDVDLNGGESLRGRFGGRMLKTITTNIDRQWTPYIEANLLHEFLSDGSITASNVRFDSESMGTSLQLGGGLNARLGLNSSAFASLSYEKGLTSASADIWGGNVGVRFDF